MGLMDIQSAQFIKGIVQDDEIMNNGLPQVAFIGRSNVGKSSLINALTKSTLSRVSSSAGSTQEINFFLINRSLYFVDLPGYGFAKASNTTRDALSSLIHSYLFNDVYVQKKVVLIVDINVGMTDKDILMFEKLVQHKKDIIIALSKVDKITQSELHRNLTSIKKITGDCPLFLFSSKKGTGVSAIITEIIQ
jgi:GTP-binding protein